MRKTGFSQSQNFTPSSAGSFRTRSTRLSQDDFFSEDDDEEMNELYMSEED